MMARSRVQQVRVCLERSGCGDATKERAEPNNFFFFFFPLWGEKKKKKKARNVERNANVTKQEKRVQSCQRCMKPEAIHHVGSSVSPDISERPETIKRKKINECNFICIESQGFHKKQKKIPDSRPLYVKPDVLHVWVCSCTLGVWVNLCTQQSIKGDFLILPSWPSVKKMAEKLSIEQSKNG